jgi:lysozyme
LTIGYGHTSDVSEGQTITEHDAEELLRKDLMWFEQEVLRLITVPLSQHEFDAIVSFTFNTGSGALSESTFRRRMNAGDDKATCFREEFPKWVNGPNGALAGLVRRREAEVNLSAS